LEAIILNFVWCCGTHHHPWLRKIRLSCLSHNTLGVFGLFIFPSGAQDVIVHMVKISAPAFVIYLHSVYVFQPLNRLRSGPHFITPSEGY